MLRKAVSGEGRIIAELAVQMWKSHTIDELAEGFERAVTGPETCVFVALKDDNIIAFAQCGLRHDYVEGTSSSPVGYLEGVFVQPEYRHNGVALKLIRNCMKWAKTMGCTEFASDCELGNSDSFKFHLATGFTETNRIICFVKKL